MNASRLRGNSRRFARAPIALWLAVALGAPLRAADAASPPAPAARGQNSEPSEAPGPFDLIRFNNESSSHYYYPQAERLRPAYYFFPPNPPPLGTPVRPALPAPTGISAPPELTAYVNEPFYPLLAARLAADDLPRRLQTTLTEFRAAKVALQNELRARLARLKDAEPAARQQELASLAASQAPRLAELEATTAQLRADLLPSGALFGGHDGWNEARRWHLAPARTDETATETLPMEFEVMRAAAYYQDGLSPAQRRLVRETAMELQNEIHQSGEPAPPQSTGIWIFFSPEMARIRVPADLPAAVASRIAAFVAEKSRLKEELRDALRQYDAAGADVRTRALRQLAVQQAPRIAALDELAENIRRDLAGGPNLAGPPTPPPLPAELAGRISTYRSHKLELLKTLRAVLMEPPATARPRVEAISMQEQVAAINREHAAQFAQLKAENEAIRDALTAYVRRGHGAADRKSIDDLLEEFENARQAQEVWDRYRDYQLAVLLPGLSPEQRRLLFDAAVEGLALPLPPGEIPD